MEIKNHSVWIVWYTKELLVTGYVKSKYDDATFYWHKESTLQYILSSHADDFCWARTNLFQNIVINCVQNLFTVSKEKLLALKHVGLNTNHGIFMHQKEYIEETEVVEIDKPNQKDYKLLPHKTQQLLKVAAAEFGINSNKARYGLCSKCCK